MPRKQMPDQLNDPEWLKQQYSEHPLEWIANLLDISRNTVRNRMIAFDIERRSSTDHFRGKPKSAEQRAKFAEARRKHWASLSDEAYRIHVENISRGKQTKGGISKQGRRIYIFGRGRMLEHRYVAEQILGRPLKSSEHIHHIDGNRLNNDPANLKVVSNLEHQGYHGRKLAEADVLEIRKLWAEGAMNQHQLARIFNVAVSTVHRIIHYERWRHI